MATYVAERLVEFRDTDAAGMMHFSSYFPYMESVEHAFLRSLGWSVVCEDEQGKLSWPRVSAQCDYVGPAKFEDVLSIELSIGRIGAKSVTYRFEFRLRDRVVARGQITAVCCRMTAEGPVGVPIPEPLVEQLRPYVAAD
ncbi:MAG: acyl-CoA thioesterase [Planctomycetales bacterium]|nr:acyl-CoA thioesterase [Planctomycetales bacterium]